jgi:hypothetical protein
MKWACQAAKLSVEPAPFSIVKRYPTGVQTTSWALKNVLEVAVICHKTHQYWRNLQSTVVFFRMYMSFGFSNFICRSRRTPFLLNG